MKDINGKEVLYFSIDTETYLMGVNNVTPKLVCLTYSDQTMLGKDQKASIFVPWDDTPEQTIASQLIYMMESFVGSSKNIYGYEEVHMVGQNVCYDLRVLSKHYPAFLPYVFKWLNEDRIHDIQIREKLLNLTRWGDIDIVTQYGSTKRVAYHLYDMEINYLGIDRTAMKEAADSVRMTYYLMDGKPLNLWPPEYLSYALEDATSPLQIFQCQNAQAMKCEQETTHKAFTTETFRVRVNWALQLLTWVGTKVDQQELLRIDQQVREEYASDRLRQPLIDAGFVEPPIPPQPFANGAQEHVFGCVGHKEHPQFVKGVKVTCSCPPKMTKGKDEKQNKNLIQDYMLAAAKADPRIRLMPSDTCIKSLKEMKAYHACVDEEGFFLQKIISDLNSRQIGDDPKQKLLFTMDDLWMQSYGLLDPYLSVLAERNKLNKMVQDYLPKLFWQAEDGSMHPAETIHAEYDCLKKTGRTSSYAGKLYPSRNDQNVDPRIRNCTIPRSGNVLVSTDIGGMELGTLAQRCYNIFGHSVLRDKINAGVDTHAFLGAQIANAFDPVFCQYIKDYNQSPSTDFIYEVFTKLKGSSVLCDSQAFLRTWQVTHPDYKDPIVWGNFWKHYRTFAKPTGLGYPGGLGAATFIAYAKGTYGVDVDLTSAESLKKIWAATYPEVPAYLDYLGKNMIDHSHSGDTELDEEGKRKKVTWYAYDTPRGMHRARCTFCKAANGSALQAFAAEGATDGLYEVVKAMWLAEEGSLLYGCIPLAFIHDEILWEGPNDSWLGLRAHEVERIMVDRMSLITPDVRASADSAAMLRWDKRAEPLWDGDTLKIWTPEIS